MIYLAGDKYRRLLNGMINMLDPAPYQDKQSADYDSENLKQGRILIILMSPQIILAALPYKVINVTLHVT